MIMQKIKITQIKSVIDRPKKQKDTMVALGFKKMNQTIVKEGSPQVKGMIAKVSHLLLVEEV